LRCTENICGKPDDNVINHPQFSPKWVQNRGVEVEDRFNEVEAEKVGNQRNFAKKTTEVSRSLMVWVFLGLWNV
jgi:hypothetical protein